MVVSGPRRGHGGWMPQAADVRRGRHHPNKAEHCPRHAKDDMVNPRRRCDHSSGYTKQSSYGKVGGKTERYTYVQHAGERITLLFSNNRTTRCGHRAVAASSRHTNGEVGGKAERCAGHKDINQGIHVTFVQLLGL